MIPVLRKGGSGAQRVAKCSTQTFGGSNDSRTDNVDEEMLLLSAAHEEAISS